MNLEKLEVKSDWRGSLVESFMLPNDGMIFYITTKPNELRGNHYHLRKTEHFLVIWGSAEIQTKDRETGDIMKVEVSGLRPLIVTITPNHTHNLIASDEGCICLVWCDEQFNEEDSDTYSEEI